MSSKSNFSASFVAICILLAALPLFGAEPNHAPLRSGDVVAFLGGTNMVNLQRNGRLGTILTAAFADAKPGFRDLAWEGDTVYLQRTVNDRWRKDKFGSLAKQLDESKATVVIAQFGQTEPFDGLEKLDAFSEAFGGLLDVMTAKDRRVIIISPVRFEQPEDDLIPSLPSHHQIAYAQKMKSLALARGATYVDLMQDKQLALTTNGIHVGPEKRHIVAEEIAQSLGLPLVGSKELQGQVTAKHQLWMSYWRPANWKCLFGDDGGREFGKSTAGGPTLREEWSQLPAMIAEREEAIWKLAAEEKTE